GVVGFDGGEPFVDQPDRGSGGRCDAASEFQCRRGRGACGPVEGLRVPHEQFDRLVLCDDLAQLLQRRRFVVASGHGQRRGKDAVGVAGRDPDPHRADVEAQATASAETHWMAALTAAMAAGIAVGSLPPPWARSGLPPPPPPSSPQARDTSRPAWRPAERAASVEARTTTRLTLLTPTPTTTDVLSLTRARRSVTTVRTSPPAATSPRSATTNSVAPTVSAVSRNFPAEASSCWELSLEISFSASLRRLIRSETRPGTSVPGTLSISDS